MRPLNQVVGQPHVVTPPDVWQQIVAQYDGKRRTAPFATTRNGLLTHSDAGGVPFPLDKTCIAISNSCHDGHVRRYTRWSSRAELGA